MPDTFDRLKQALADRHAIERELGSGGMATVYLAEDLKHHARWPSTSSDPTWPLRLAPSGEWPVSRDRIVAIVPEDAAERKRAQWA